MNMPKLSRGLGIALILLGIIGYFATGQQSITALIPTFFGVIMLILGLLGSKEKIRKHAMHGASLLALLGLAGTAMGVSKLFELLSGGDVERPAAVVSQSVMALLCLLFVLFSIKSFMDARRSQPASDS